MNNSQEIVETQIKLIIQRTKTIVLLKELRVPLFEVSYFNVILFARYLSQISQNGNL